MEALQSLFALIILAQFPLFIVLIVMWFKGRKDPSILASPWLTRLFAAIALSNFVDFAWSGSIFSLLIFAYCAWVAWSRYKKLGRF